MYLSVWKHPGLPGWQKVNYDPQATPPKYSCLFVCLTTSPGFLPALCERWSGLFYVHWILLPFGWDWQLKVSSERLGNEDKAPCPRALLSDRGSKQKTPVWKSEISTAWPQPLLNTLTFKWTFSPHNHIYSRSCIVILNLDFENY